MDLTYKIALFGAIVASYAAIVATSVFFWDIIKWKKEGVKLRIEISPKIRGYGDSVTLGLSVRVTNIGKAATVLGKEKSVLLSSPIKMLFRLQAQDALRLGKQISYSYWEEQERLESGDSWEGEVSIYGIPPGVILKKHIYCGIKHSLVRKTFYGRSNLKNVKREGEFQ